LVANSTKGTNIYFNSHSSASSTPALIATIDHHTPSQILSSDWIFHS